MGFWSRPREIWPGGIPAFDQSRRLDARVADLPATLFSGLPRSRDNQNIQTRMTVLTTRSAVSIVERILARESIYDDVDAEACVVYRREALIVGMVVPFGAVVLVAVKHRDAIAA